MLKGGGDRKDVRGRGKRTETVMRWLRKEKSSMSMSRFSHHQ